MNRIVLPWQAIAYISTQRHGLFSRYRLRLLQLPLVLGVSLATALVPATADDWLFGFAEAAAYRISPAMTSVG